MSTDPKSAVPAGATRQCRKCRAFYRLYRTKNKNTFDYLSERHCEPACSMSDLEPIAEAEQPGKATDPRPAQPSKEKIEKARKLAMKIFAFHNSGNADLGKETAWIEAYAEHVVAPLREERDRLACELEAMRRERNGAQSQRDQRDQERARAEQAEARLSAAPSEAPRHCRICEEPMSDTCEECQ